MNAQHHITQRSRITIACLLVAVTSVLAAPCSAQAQVEGPGLLPDQFAALVALYKATDGPNWIKNDGWPDPDKPEWFGVQVTLEGISISLSGNGLKGNIPKSILGLRNVSHIDLSYNDLSGSIPEDGLRRPDCAQRTRPLRQRVERLHPRKPRAASRQSA